MFPLNTYLVYHRPVESHLQLASFLEVDRVVTGGGCVLYLVIRHCDFNDGVRSYNELRHYCLI